MKKISPLQRIKKQADKLWFDKYLQEQCEVCGKPAIQLHHFYFKGSYLYLRWDKDNAISLCKSCHFVLHMQDPKGVEYKIIKKRGKKWHTALQKKAFNPPKNFKSSIKWVKEQIDILK